MAKRPTKKKAKRQTASKKKLAKKKTKKKAANRSRKKAPRRGRGRADPRPGENGDGAGSLGETLRAAVVDQLVRWQADPTRDGIRRLMYDIGSQMQLLTWSVARVELYHGHIKAARDSGKLYPWILPYPAAVTFESMFQVCAGVWLLAGEPKEPDELLSSVDDYIKLQTRMFDLMVGN